MSTMASRARSLGAPTAASLPLTVATVDAAFDDLVIVDGLVASVEIARLLFVVGKIPKEEHDRVRQDLLNYCERDTWAMVKVLERLRELAA
jgi:hypothetical protein